MFYSILNNAIFHHNNVTFLLKLFGIYHLVYTEVRYSGIIFLYYIYLYVYISGVYYAISNMDITYTIRHSETCERSEQMHLWGLTRLIPTCDVFK